MFLLGKLRNDIFCEVVFFNFGVEDSKVVYGFREGFDLVVFEYDDEYYFVVVIDLMFGVLEEIFGFFIYYFVLSDVVVFGVRLRWFVVDFFFFEGILREFFEVMMKDLNVECCKYGLVIVGGYIGVYLSILELIVMIIVMGIVRKGELKFFFVKLGDKIVVMVKVGFEFVVLVVYFRVDEFLKVLIKKEFMRFKCFFYFEMVVFDVLVVKFFVRGMYDVIEGGLMVFMR